MPSSPMRQRCGTRTLSKCSCAVSDEFMPAFFSLRATSTPLVFIGTQISVLLRCAEPPSLVLASTQHQSAWVPLVVHILPPLMT